MRDAANGSEFAAAVRERYDLDARTIGGDEEAALTFAGATSERADIGRARCSSSTSAAARRSSSRDAKGAVDFHVSTQAGVVRQTERHIDHDPPRPDEVDSLRREVSQIIRDNVPAERRRSVALGIAVAGTATSCAAIELGLDPYDRALVHGHVLRRTICTGILDRLSRMTDAERRAVTGLQPDRAPTIVAGVAMLLEVMDAFGLEDIEVSEHDILRGAALRLASADRP